MCSDYLSLRQTSLKCASSWKGKFPCSWWSSWSLMVLTNNIGAHLPDTRVRSKKQEQEAEYCKRVKQSSSLKPPTRLTFSNN